jgi:hypothetical protein
MPSRVARPAIIWEMDTMYAAKRFCSRLRYFLLCLPLLQPSASTAIGQQQAETDGFVWLFRGADLSQWQMGPDRSWVVEDGVIRLRREMDGAEHNADYLWTKETFGDFVLELEFQIPERANSGVFLRTSDLTDPVYTGIEVQVANSFGRETWSKGNCAGAIYDCLAPTANAVKPPGQWNHYRITCLDNRITVALNGRQVIEMDLNRWSQANLNPDGTPNKFPRPLAQFARQGHIGLQDHGRDVGYRNIRVKRLDGASHP